MSAPILATVIQPDPDTPAVSGQQCWMEINGETTLVELSRGLAPVADDVLIVHRIGTKWYATNLTGAAAPPPAPAPRPRPPAPKPAVRTGTLVVAPTFTGTYRAGSGGWRTDNNDVYQGQWESSFGNNTGAVFYGTKARSLAGATVTKATIRVRRKNGGGITAPQSTTLWLVTQSSKPAGAPTRTLSTAGPSLRWGATVDAFVIPDAWAQAMVDGTAGGLALFEADSNPYVIMQGKGSWSAAFTLTIHWRRG